MAISKAKSIGRKEDEKKKKQTNKIFTQQSVYSNMFWIPCKY